MKQALIVLILTIYSINISKAQQPSKEPQIKLLVQIVVEQMRYEILTRYWNRFSNDGFKKLINQGTFCKNAYYDYMFTESASGYATIATGSNPTFHGIVADKWYDRLYDREFDCVEDKSLKNTNPDFDRNKYSPKLITGSTLGDELRLSNYKKSKVISISMNHAASVLTGGKLANAAYWFDNETGKWISSAFYMDLLPEWVNAFNNRDLPSVYLSKTWNTLRPISSYVNSLSDNNSYEIGFNSKRVFPYDLKELSKSEGTKIIKSTPYGNTYTTDFSIAAMFEEGLGKDEFTDLLAINYSTTSNVNSLFSIRSIELEDIYLRLDRDIAHLLRVLEDRIGAEHILVVLTSDRGAADSPDFRREIGLPTGEFDSERTISLLESYLKALYGRKQWVKYYKHKQIYLNQLLVEKSKLSLADMQLKAANFIAQFDGVARVATANYLQDKGFKNVNMQKFQNSFHLKHSGDIVINLKPGWLEVRKHKTKNYIKQSSPYRYDTHVPLIFYGWKIKHQEILEDVKMNSVAPTLSNLLNISYTDNSHGKAINNLVKNN